MSLGCDRPVTRPPTILDAPAAQAATEKADAPPGEEKEPEQTYEEAWDIICNAEELSEVEPGLPQVQHNSAVVSWLVAHLKNKKARYWFLELDEKEAQHRPALFKAEAQRGGVADCKLATLLFPNDPASSAPVAE